MLRLRLAGGAPVGAPVGARSCAESDRSAFLILVRVECGTGGVGQFVAGELGSMAGGISFPDLGWNCLFGRDGAAVNLSAGSTSGGASVGRHSLEGATPQVVSIACSCLLVAAP